MIYTVFNKDATKSHLEKTMFLDGGVDIARYESVKYSWMDKMYDKQIGFFWRPQEVDTQRDGADFAGLNDVERHIFVSNLKRQILLDSVQGRAPALAFLPFASLPELEVFIQAWGFFETIHSRSYSHIIRVIYPSNPSKIFDELKDIPRIS